jgi:hypothetical protein
MLYKSRCFIQNEPNPKAGSQKTEDGGQNKKMCISIFQIKDCAAVFPANCLGYLQGAISDWQKTKPNEPNFDKLPDLLLGQDIGRIKRKISNFLHTKKLTESLNPVECCFFV